jgi:hypothetical protein
MYPELLKKVIEYIKWYIRQDLKAALVELGSASDISQRTGKAVSEITTEEGVDPFKVVSMDVFSSRHLFRLPYSLHEKNLLVSLPIKPERIDKFERDDALPERVKVEEKFLKVGEGKDAEGLLIEALDWASKYMIEKVEVPKEFQPKAGKPVPEKIFPPCIKRISEGMADGRKRSVFVLVNFLRSMNWSLEKIEKFMFEWNEKNTPPLRTHYLRGQLRWHFRQDRSLLPPSCEKENFYKEMGVCMPDDVCKSNDKITIKNPVNYPFKKMKRKQR